MPNCGLLRENVYKPAYGKRDLMNFRFVVLVVRAQSPILAKDMRSFPEASSRSLLHACEQQRLWRDCAYAQARLSLCWSPM